jgi:predicted transcriptional regulator
VRKTTVYLNDEQAAALRQLAAASGKSQAELIREAIQKAVSDLPARRFRSLGLGQGTGKATPRWKATQVYDKAFGLV